MSRFQKQLRAASSFIFGFTLLLGCGSKEPSQLKEMEWMIGTWQIGSQSVYERWENVSDTEFKGVNFSVEGSDTTVHEYIQLRVTEESVFYIPRVIEQNQGMPIQFKLISEDPKKLVFQNKEHDFPQLIVYVKNNDTSIDAWIEGEVNGKLMKSDFKMTKLIP